MYLTVLINVLFMILYLLIGFVCCKVFKADAKGAKSISTLLVYIFSPAMIINSFVRMEYNKDDSVKILEFFFVSLALQLLSFLILFLIFRKKYEDAKYRIMSVAGILGNVGYFGLPVVTGLFPDSPVVACYSSIFVLSMNLIVFTIGTFLITADKKYVSIKSAILNPTTISLVIALPLYFCKVDFPDEIDNVLNLFAKMVTPLSMIVLGMRLSTMDLKSLFTKPFVYLTAALKLIAFPILAFLCVYFLPCFDETFKVSLIVLCGCPSGAIIVSLAELHDKEKELAANSVLLSTIFCAATLPLLLLILEAIMK